MCALLVNPECHGIILRTTREYTVGRRTADAIHRKTMFLLACLNRRPRQRTCDTVRRPRQIAGLDEQLLYVLHHCTAHPLLHADVRRLGGRMECKRRSDGKCRPDRKCTAKSPQFPVLPCPPHEVLRCQKEFPYLHSIVLPSFIFR